MVIRATRNYSDTKLIWNLGTEDTTQSHDSWHHPAENSIESDDYSLNYRPDVILHHLLQVDIFVGGGLGTHNREDNLIHNLHTGHYFVFIGTLHSIALGGRAEARYLLVCLFGA